MENLGGVLFFFPEAEKTKNKSTVIISQIISFYESFKINKWMKAYSNM